MPLALKYWETEEAREAGESQITYLENKGVRNAINQAKNLFYDSEIAAIEVVYKPDQPNETVFYSIGFDDENIVELKEGDLN